MGIRETSIPKTMGSGIDTMGGDTASGATIMELPSLQSLRRRELVLSPGAAEHDAGERNPFKIRLAGNAGLRRDASSLIKERYAQRGYATQELAADANRLTIVAYHGASRIGTLSVGMDSQAGLLCDDLYRPEIDQLRKTGRKVCEFIKFAVDTPAYSVNTLSALFHTAFIFAYRLHGVDDVVAEVNPRHVKFYERGLGFRQFGEERINQRVNAPAILLRGEFTVIARQIAALSGKLPICHSEKSLYTYGFSPQEEAQILQRLAAMRD